MERTRRSRIAGEPVEAMAQHLQAGLWLREVQRAYLGAINKVVWARAHGLYHLDPETGQPLHFAGRVPDGFADEYEQEGRAGDVVLQAAVAGGQAVDSSRAIDPGGWRTSPVYEVLARQGFGHSMEAPLYLDDDLIGTLNLARRPTDPPFDDREVALIERVAAHVELALERALRHEVTEERSGILEATLDAVPQALVVSHAGGRLLMANRAARTISSRRARGQAVAPEQLVEPNLRELAEGHKKVVHSFVPAPPRRDREPLVLAKSVRLTACGDAVLSFLSPRDAEAQLPVEHTTLSSREQELVELVSRGLSTTEMADAAYISVNTVKQHLKRIFQKLGVHSRAELIQAVWQGGPDDRDQRDDPENYSSGY